MQFKDLLYDIKNDAAHVKERIIIHDSDKTYDITKGALISMRQNNIYMELEVIERNGEFHVYADSQDSS